MESGQTVQVIRRAEPLQLYSTSNDMGKIYDNGYAAIEPVFIAHLNQLQEGNVLEIGAANGHTLRRLQESNPKGPIRYILNEIDPHSQGYLRVEFPLIDGSAVTPVLSKAPVLQHLRNNKQSYDAIYSAMGFHFFDPVQYVDTLLECHRNLKSGGKLFMLQNNYVFRAHDPGMTDFQAKKAEGSFFPGYYTSRRAAGINWFDAHNTIMRGKPPLEIARGIVAPEKYPLLNYHDRESLTRLFAACGFEVELSQNYFEKYNNNSAVSYVGIIARKSHVPLDDDKITRLKQSASVLTELAERSYPPYFSLDDGAAFNEHRVPFIVDMSKI